MPPHRPVTIRDLALITGYSTATVSLALRDSPRIRLRVREEIRKEADARGYRPNPLMAAHWNTVRARRPVSYQATIALLNDMDSRISWKKTPWGGADLFEGFRERCEELGYVVDELHVGGADDQERLQRLAQAARVMKARGIAAYAVIMSNHPRLFLPAALHFEDFSGVFVCSQAVAISNADPSLAHHLPFHRVNPDRYGNMLVLLDQLHSAGYRRIGFWPNQWSEIVNEGSAAAAFLLWSHKRPVRERVGLHSLRWSSMDSMDALRVKFLRWLEQSRPDAIVCENFEVRRWIESAGRRIPRDVGLAHLALGPMEPDWSGINIHRDRIASAAADLLTAHVQRNDRGTPHFPKDILIEGSWVQGKTTKRAVR